jgi:hypothetical protein
MLFAIRECVVQVRRVAREGVVGEQVRRVYQDRQYILMEGYSFRKMIKMGVYYAEVLGVIDKVINEFWSRVYLLLSWLGK